MHIWFFSQYMNFSYEEKILRYLFYFQPKLTTIMNEAELHHEVPILLRKIFPTFQNMTIESERSFSIKFGRHNAVIDNKDATGNENRGIFDLLVKVDGQPKIILELKAPDHTINEDDVRQGISYARLTHPICPITVISNGKDTQVYDTITKKRLSGDELKGDVIARLESAMTVASSEALDSFLFLLERDHALILSVIHDLTRETRENLTGTFDQWQKPLVKDFSISREQLSEFERMLDTDNFIHLSGDAFSGKTNFVFQYIEQQEICGNGCLYIETRGINYPLFQIAPLHSFFKRYA